jgi:hypothetical protein
MQRTEKLLKSILEFTELSRLRSTSYMKIGKKNCHAFMQQRDKSQCNSLQLNRIMMQTSLPARIKPDWGVTPDVCVDGV